MRRKIKVDKMLSCRTIGEVLLKNGVRSFDLVNDALFAV
jgi:hypothetical protein